MLAAHMRFNHVAVRVAGDHFEGVVGMFEALGFAVLRRTARSVWLRQAGANVDVQLSRSDTPGRDGDKVRSQVSFLSETPRGDLEALAVVAAGLGVRAEVGAYSEREFYLDAPDAFVDFVIEAMLPELADYGV